MANVQLSAGTSSVVKTHYFKQQNNFSLWRKPVHMLVAVLNRFWWQTKVYGNILGIIALVFVSLVFLYIHKLRSQILSDATK